MKNTAASMTLHGTKYVIQKTRGAIRFNLSWPFDYSSRIQSQIISMNALETKIRIAQKNDKQAT
jgi:hypothetical protein